MKSILFIILSALLFSSCGFNSGKKNINNKIMNLFGISDLAKRWNYTRQGVHQKMHEHMHEMLEHDKKASNHASTKCDKCIKMHEQ